MRRRIGVAAAVAMAACGGSESSTGPTPPPRPVVATVEVTPAADTVRVGAVVQFSAVAKDAQGTAITGRTVSWATSNSAMATVSPAGEVTGVARGTTTVTATVEGRSGSAAVVVEDETSLLPVAGCRDCLEIVPGGLLLTGPGQEAPLAAYLVDAAGARTKASATFTSAKPAVVTVAGTGVARAAAYGSAQVTAAANGKTSAPIVVVVASPVEGAVLVPDTVVVGRPVPSDLRAPYGVGYKYKVRLRGPVPAVGQMLVGSGSLPVLGKVVQVTPVSAGLVEAELELRPLKEALRDFAINETMPLVAAPPSVSPAGGFWPASRLPLMVDDPLEDGQFRLGPFVCATTIGGAVGFPLDVQVERFELNPSLTMEVVANSSGGTRLAVFGSVQPEAVLTPRLTAAIEAELECRKTLHRLRLAGALGGVFSLVVFPLVPVGVGFKLGMKAGLPDLSARMTLQGSASIGLAVDCANFICAAASIPPGTFSGTFTPQFPPLGARHEVEIAGFAFAKLELSNVLVDAVEAVFGDKVEFTLLDFLAGIKQTLTMATPSHQAGDSAYASEAKLSAFWEASAGAEVKVTRLLSLQLAEWTAEGDTALARTPQGTVVAVPSTVRAGVTGQPGDSVLLSAMLSPVTYLGSPSVDGVEFFREGPSGLERACFVEPDHPGQVDFSCLLRFGEEDVGTQTYYAFVQARIFGGRIATPLELADDTRMTVDVLPPCLASGSPSLSPGLADDSCGRVIEGDVTVHNDGELAALSDVGEITGDLLIGAAVTSPDLRELGALYRVGDQLVVLGAQTTLSGLRSLGEVGRQVAIGTNTIRDLRGLERLTSLNELSLKSTALADLSGLRNLRAVGHLRLEDLPLTSLAALANVEIGLLPVVSGAGLWIDDLNTLTSLAGLKPLAADFPGSVWITGNNVLADLAVLRNTTRIRRDLVILTNGALQNLSHLAALQQVDERLSLHGTSITSLDALSGLTSVGLLYFYPEYRPFVYRLPALTRAGIQSGDRLATCSHSTVVQYEFPVLAEAGITFVGTVSPPTATQCRYDFRAPALQRGNVFGSGGSGLRDLTLGSLGSGGDGHSVDLRGLHLLRTITAPNVDLRGNLVLHDNPALTSVTGISGRVRGRLEVLRNLNLDQCAAVAWANALTVDGGRFVSGNKAC